MMKYFNVICALAWLYWPFVGAPILWPIEPVAAFAMSAACVLAAIRGIVATLDAKP